ncbi:DC-STAMP domain-containing protein 1 [Portunus trituberculatus]|uniref:DC-STAMP domain-containing protein 1 n=1 Tax=Portunus trituberculatus TaxID=210409 RepID=A0A5B7FLR9_PORTR|nr:DC-STAMP domain-containing protein 1 [Portunus trituberculatus]
MLQVIRVRLVKRGGAVMLAAVYLVLEVISTAALPVPLSETGRIHGLHYLSDAEYAEREQPKEVVVGRCKLHLWPRDSVWRLEEGEAVTMRVEVVGNCEDDITLTVQSKERGKSQQLIPAGSPGTVWKSGSAQLARQGEKLHVHLATLEQEIFLTKLVEIDFPPRITMLTTLPYQGRSLFAYFMYLLIQRQKELITGKSMSPLLGWDMGESVSVRVRVEGNPKPRIIWRVKKTDINPGESLGNHYEALNETSITPTQSVYELQLRQVTLKMAQDGLKLIARNKLQQKVLPISVAVNMFSVASQRQLANAVTKSLGLVVLMYVAMFVIHVMNRVYNKVARIAREQWDIVIYYRVTMWLPLRTLNRVFQMLVGLCISLALMAYFNIQGQFLRLLQVLFMVLFVTLVSYMYGSHTRVRAAVWMTVLGMLSNMGIFLLAVSTTEVVVNASYAVTANLVQVGLQVQCVSQIHVSMFRESMLAYLNPVTKKQSDYAEVMLVKERDMKMAQEAMKLKADTTLNDAVGEKLGEQKVSEKKNRAVDREYEVQRFAKVRKESRGGHKEKTKMKKKFVFKNFNVCQELGSNILIQCLTNKMKVYLKCVSSYPWIVRWLGKLICKAIGKAIDCVSMYKDTEKKLKCNPPMDVEEVAQGLLLLNDGPSMFYGDASPSTLQQMYNKPVNIKFARDKMRQDAATVTKRLEDAKACMSVMYTAVVICLVVYTANKVIGDMIKYDQSLSWENIYIGEYFRKIDRKRGRLGLPRLLPLKRHEKRIYIESIFSTKPKKEEKEELKLRVTICVAVQILTAILFLIDYFVFIVTMYEVVRENLTYSVHIDDYLKVHAPGDSFLSSLMNLVFEKINVDNQVLKTFRRDKCNPKVHFPNMALYSKHEALLLFLFLLNLVLRCPDRLKHVILRFYYPNREKKRQIKLYSNILFTREKFVQLAVKQMVWVRAHGKLTKLHDPQWQDLLLRQFRSLGFVLRFFFRAKCAICKTKGTKRYVMCKGPACTMVYCRPCWELLGARCLSCTLVITHDLLEKFATDEQGLFDK